MNPPNSLVTHLGHCSDGVRVHVWAICGQRGPFFLTGTGLKLSNSSQLNTRFLPTEELTACRYDQGGFPVSALLILTHVQVFCMQTFHVFWRRRDIWCLQSVKKPKQEVTLKWSRSCHTVDCARPASTLCVFFFIITIIEFVEISV